jgi:hypothetical protein
MNTVPPSPNPAASLPAASTLKIARPCEVTVATISAPSGSSVSDTLRVEPVDGIGNATRPLLPNSASGVPSGSA